MLVEGLYGKQFYRMYKITAASLIGDVWSQWVPRSVGAVTEKQAQRSHSRPRPVFRLLIL